MSINLLILVDEKNWYYLPLEMASELTRVRR
uniref:Uncharacterized protein n=1 Tax=Rhizophora mucronata TaxID=61149 RepID=A0A2P2PVF1_RHIMU